MLNKRKHKNFNYKSRYSKDDLVETEPVVKDKASKAWLKIRRTGANKKTNSRLFVLLLLLSIIIVVLYYLETQIG